MTGSAQTLARRANHALLARRAAEAIAGAVAAGLAVGLAARLEGWASPAAVAVAAGLAALLAFWAAARAHPGAASALNPDSDGDALLRSALSVQAESAWGELLAISAAQRQAAFLPVGEWIPAALLAVAAMFALAWQDGRPRTESWSLPPAAGSSAAPADADFAAEAARRQAAERAEIPAGDGEAAAAQGEWRALEPTAASGSILLPPGAAARERGAIERYLRRQAGVDE